MMNVRTCRETLRVKSGEPVAVIRTCRETGAKTIVDIKDAAKKVADADSYCNFAAALDGLLDGLTMRTTFATYTRFPVLSSEQSQQQQNRCHVFDEFPWRWLGGNVDVGDTFQIHGQVLKIDTPQAARWASAWIRGQDLSLEDWEDGEPQYDEQENQYSHPEDYQDLED